MSASISINLAVRGAQHLRLAERLRDRINAAQQAMGDRKLAWDRLENDYLAYMPETAVDSVRKGLRDQNGLPQYTTIVVPYSYAMMLTAHTYQTSVFFGRSPLQQVQGRHGEGQMQEQAIEALLDYQVNSGLHLPPYYIWLHDMLKYGLGIVGYYWEDEMISSPRYEIQEETFLGVKTGRKKRVKVEQVHKGYSGTKLYNVRPQDWLTDPRVTYGNFQQGEFCGRYIELSRLELLEGQARKDYVNVEELLLRGPSNGQRDIGNSQMQLPGAGTGAIYSKDNDLAPFKGYEVYVKLLPREWGFGGGEKAEVWVFTIMTDDIIISAKPVGYWHGKFPFEALEGEVGGHATYNRSMLEVLQPMNDVLSWLVNTHFFNVRKSLNDQFIVDPSRIVMKDFTDPGPGRLLRLKPEAYGSDVRAVVSQLPVQDVTRAHLTDFNLVAEMMQRVGGVNDSLMGMVNSGRRSATEVRASTTFGVNRMKTVAEYAGATGFGPLTQQLIQVTQQMYDDDRQYRVAGSAAKLGAPYRKITPEDIAGFYDFVPVDGTMPVDRFAQVNLWQTMMAQLGQMPQVAGQYDFGKIFGFVAQLAGLKNIEQFRLSVADNEQVALQAAKGNLVPMNEVASATTSGMPEPGQVPGMGPTL